MDIEIIYASKDKQVALTISVDPPCSVASAIQQSGICQQVPEINLQQQTVGIWNKAVALDTLCADRDRIEIYRSLIIDPKQARKKRIL